MKSSNNCKCRKLTGKKLDMEVPVAKQSVFVKNVPVRVCDDCGAIYINGPFVINLEREVLKRQKQAA